MTATCNHVLGPFDHYTRKGWVRRHDGKYARALALGARVTPLIVETTGAIEAHSLKFIAHLSKRARGKRARDGTRYGRVRMSTRSFYVHHTQRISMAAVLGDVVGVHESLRGMKQRMIAGSGAGGGS